eukprot:6267806-Lingulodinium_polyedra.AAC.1
MDFVGMATEDWPEVEPTDEVVYEGLLVDDDEGVALDPGEQAWVPVRAVAARALAGGAAAQARDHGPREGVVPIVLPAG